jgi:hypothetical protein
MFCHALENIAGERKELYALIDGRARQALAMRPEGSKKAYAVSPESEKEAFRHSVFLSAYEYLSRVNALDLLEASSNQRPRAWSRVWS